MLGLSRIDKHAELVGRMAETVGADLAEAMQRGDLTPEEYRSAVLSCTSCRGAGDCQEWLDAHSDGAEATPGYCRNKALLESLADS